MQSVHPLFGRFSRGAAGGDQLPVRCAGADGRGDHAVIILRRHGNRPAHKVAEVVCKVGVVDLDQAFVADGAVVLVGHFAENIVTDPVHAEAVGKLVCVQHVSFGFGHFVLPKE